MPERVRYVAELADRIESDPELRRQLQEDPVNTLRAMAEHPLETDVWIYRLVVIFLGSVAVIAALGGIWIGSSGAQIPDLLTALGSAAIGALAGLLAPSPTASASR